MAECSNSFNRNRTTLQPLYMCSGLYEYTKMRFPARNAFLVYAYLEPRECVWWLHMSLSLLERS